MIASISAELDLYIHNCADFKVRPVASQEDLLKVAATARCEYFEAVDRIPGCGWLLCLMQTCQEQGGLRGRARNLQPRSENFQSWFCHEELPGLERAGGRLIGFSHIVT